MSEENEVFDLNALANEIEKTPLKYLIYGTAGSGKSVNAVSLLPAYLAGGWQVIYVFTENNAIVGFKEGLKIYGPLIQPFLKKDQLFIADLTPSIAEKNRNYLAKVDNKENNQLTLGAAFALCWFFTEAPKVKDFTEGAAGKEKLFRGMGNLTALSKKEKVLVIVDGYSPVDIDLGGLVYWAQDKKKIDAKNAAMFFGGLKGKGSEMMLSLFGGFPTDLVVLAHDKLQSIDTTNMLSGEAQTEQQLRRTLLDEQMQTAEGFPSLATNTTISKVLGSFSLVLHATDTRLANNLKLSRFIFDIPVQSANQPAKWYTRTSLNFLKASKLYAAKNGSVETWPQDWSKALGLTFLLNEQKIDAEVYETLINLTKQQKLI